MHYSQEGISMPLNRGRNIRTQLPTFIFLQAVNDIHFDLLLTFFRSRMRLSARWWRCEGSTVWRSQGTLPTLWTSSSWQPWSIQEEDAMTSLLASRDSSPSSTAPSLLMPPLTRYLGSLAVVTFVPRGDSPRRCVKLWRSWSLAPGYFGREQR